MLLRPVCVMHFPLSLSSPWVGCNVSPASSARSVVLCFEAQPDSVMRLYRTLTQCIFVGLQIAHTVPQGVVIYRMHLTRRHSSVSANCYSQKTCRMAAH